MKKLRLALLGCPLLVACATTPPSDPYAGADSTSDDSGAADRDRKSVV